MLGSEFDLADSQLTPLQKTLVDMLKWFHLFCIENELRYYVIDGTMLGTIRHKGFIPWDDDIDVGLPRKDYERLAKLMDEVDSGPYILETPYSKEKDFCYPHSKLYDTRTTLIEKKRVKVVRGVFIDVFPLDGLGDSEEDCIKNYKPIKRKYNLLLSLVCGIRNGRAWYKNLAVLFFRCIPSFIFNQKKLMIELDKMCASREYETCAWICNDLGAWGVKDAVPHDVLGEPTIYQFENIEVCGVLDYESYLTRLYGNWREIPPKEKQVSHHEYVSLDLERPFISYGEKKEQ